MISECINSISIKINLKIILACQKYSFHSSIFLAVSAGSLGVNIGLDSKCVNLSITGCFTAGVILVNFEISLTVFVPITRTPLKPCYFLHKFKAQCLVTK